jgi:hypothetical protein
VNVYCDYNTRGQMSIYINGPNADDDVDETRTDELDGGIEVD